MSGGTRNTDTSGKVTGCVNWSLLRAKSIGSVKPRHGRNAQRYGSKTRPFQRNVTYVTLITTGKYICICFNRRTFTW
jgi:hypothetical protein